MLLAIEDVNPRLGFVVLNARHNSGMWIVREGEQDSSDLSHPLLAGLIKKARARAMFHLPRVALVFPCDALALAAAGAIRCAAIAHPVLLGPSELILRTADAQGIAVDQFEIIDTGPDPARASALAVKLAGTGVVSALMKGSLHTDELMSAVVLRNGGLRTERRMSHTALFEVPRYSKILGISDCGVNIAPDLSTKRDIVTNSVELLRALGIEEPKVAVLAAVETINPAIAATVDAARLAEIGQSGYWGSAIVEGPLGFDNAVSATAARIKNMKSRVSGDADLLVVPDLNTGNVLYKSLAYMAGGECAAVVLGARIPVVVTSRADSMTSRLASVAVAVLSCPPEGKHCDER